MASASLCREAPSDENAMVRRKRGTAGMGGKRPSLQERRARRHSSFNSSSSIDSCSTDAVAITRTPSLSLNCELIVAEEQARQESCGPSLLDNYSLECKLGRGSFATVWKAQRLTTREDVCLKITPATSIDEEVVMTAQNEYNMLKAVQGHPHVVHALDFFNCPMHGCVLVLEYTEGTTTLWDAVREASKDLFTQDTARMAVDCLLQALAHVHRCRILHRDVKADNVLVKVDGITGDLCHLSLADFNTARQMTTTRCLTLTGTPDYLAPEVLLGHQHTELSDVWAVGICLYYMVSGAHPWHRTDYESHSQFGLALTKGCDCGRGVDNAEAVTPAASHKRVQHLSAECRSQISRLLDVNPATRPTAAAALGNVWLQGVPV